MVNRLCAVVLLIALLPLFLIISIAIRLDSSGPVIFKQRRVGQYQKYFTIYKFRTMVVGMPDLPAAMVKEDDHRFTRVGKFLRRFSLDELPQLFNIIKGEMDFVGPRPALYNQDDLIALRESAGIHALKPGVTGWAQVNGRETVSVEEKVRLDEYYLNNRSLLLNLKIIFLTLFNSSQGKDLYKNNVQNNISD
ncbi:MAG: sugar transferase [Bacillota bacterium]